MHGTCADCWLHIVDMAFHRGTIGSYQKWAEQVGDPSYEFSNFLPYFQRSAHFTPPNETLRFANATPYYDLSAWNNSLGGPVQASYPVYSAAIQSWGSLAMEVVSMPRINGFDSGALIGSDYALASIDPVDEERSSSQNSYLRQAMRDTGIQIYTQALAEKILIHLSNKTAYGVAVNTAGKLFTLTANKEVIVSAGTFQSPQLLMVSGIGPRTLLQKFNISLLADLPGVGQNLWDQPLISTAFRVNVETSSKLINDAAYAAMATQEYDVNRTGPFTDAGTLVGFEKVPESYRKRFSNATLEALAQFPADWPELEHIANNGVFGFNSDYMTSDPGDGYNYATVSSILIAPLSRGNISINSSSMHDAPLINPNWLTAPADIEVVVAAFKRTRDIWAAMSNVTIGDEYFPGRNVSTDAEILQLCRESVIMLYHAAGTCAMGKAGDVNAVVDTKGRVYGVHGLRVVDASIFPLLPPGHPQATVYALAEKVAEDIKLGR